MRITGSLLNAPLGAGILVNLAKIGTGSLPYPFSVLRLIHPVQMSFPLVVDPTSRRSDIPPSSVCRVEAPGTSRPGRVPACADFPTPRESLRAAGGALTSPARRNHKGVAATCARRQVSWFLWLDPLVAVARS